MKIFRKKYSYLDCVFTFCAWTNVEYLSEIQALILLAKHDHLNISLPVNRCSTVGDSHDSKFCLRVFCIVMCPC